MYYTVEHQLRGHQNAITCGVFKGELNPKIDFSSFEHLGIVEQLYEGFLCC